MDEDGNVTGTPVSGNPIRYYNGTPWNFSWAEGRSLKTAESSTPEQDISLEFSYDADGLRIEKRVTKTVYEMTAEHTYTDTVIAPTCTEAGYTVHTCECGDSYTDTEVPALGHDYAASDTPGLLACTRCEALLEHSEHSYTETVVAPTCTEAGYTLHTCECGDSYRENEIAALGHKFVRGAIVPPTCTEDGYRNFRCSRCGERKIVTIPALGHDIVNNKCTRCGYVGGATLPTVPPSQGEIMGLEEPTEPEVPLQNEPDEPADDTPDTPTENAPLHRGAATEIEETHQYIYAGGKLLRETISDGTTTKTLDFNYDNVGMPYSLIYNNGTITATYYYITNLQGDVMYLVDASGTQVASYDYDPYGKIISATGDLAEINPLRYRGYYYDTETSFYYLQSRYYDPEICRFINADSYASTGDGFTGLNMFAYCNNNPANRIDPDGHDSYVWEWITTMWWMCFADAQLPIGDIIYGAGIAILTVEYFISASQSAVPTIALDSEDDDSVTPPAPPAPSNNGNQGNNKNNRNDKKGKDYVKAKNNKTANNWAKQLGYESAEALKEDFAFKGGSKFNMAIDRNTGELVLIAIKGGVEITTGLFF